MSGTKRLLIAVAVLCLGVRCIIVPSRPGVYVRPPPPAVVVTPPPAAHPATPPPAQPMPPPPPPPAQPVPPPPPRYISQNEAINIGIRYCQSHAFACDLQEAHMTGDGVWKVKFRVGGGPGEGGHVHMDIDARNGAMIKVDEKVKQRGPGHH